MKAIALFSGGLDSLLAAKVIMDQGITVLGLTFFNGFNDVESPKIYAQEINLNLEVIDISDDFRQLMKAPLHGFGSNLNPCIDCKIMMIRKAFAILKERQYDFLITGEVVGQRPMSQRVDAMQLILNETQTADLLLRPLSAKKLLPTKPERENWVNRDLLYDFSGRTRLPQFNLAKKLGIQNFATPAGGCLLTDPAYALKLKDFLAFSNYSYTKDDLGLLRNGRYEKLSDSSLLILGRNAKENSVLENIFPKLSFPHKVLILPSAQVPGPSGIFLSLQNISDAEINIAIEKITQRIKPEYRSLGKFNIIH